MNTISDNLTAHTPIKEKKVFNIIYILQVPALLEDTKKMISKMQRLFKKRTGPVSRLTVEEERSNICLILDGPRINQALI